MAELKPVNFKVDSDLWQEAKLDALKNKQDLKDWVADAMREKLNGRKEGG